PKMRRGAGEVLGQRLGGGGMGFCKPRGSLRGRVLKHRRQWRKGALEVLDEPQRRLLLMLADEHAAALFATRGFDRIGDAVETLADIDIAEGRPFERASRLSDVAGSSAGERQRMLEERHQLWRGEAAFRCADHEIEKAAGQRARYRHACGIVDDEIVGL